MSATPGSIEVLRTPILKATPLEDDIFKTPRATHAPTPARFTPGKTEVSATPQQQYPVPSGGGDGFNPEIFGPQNASNMTTDWEQSDNERTRSPTPASTIKRVLRTPRRKVTRPSRGSAPTRRLTHESDAKLGMIIKAVEAASELNEKRCAYLDQQINQTQAVMGTMLEQVMGRIAEIQNGLNTTLAGGGSFRTCVEENFSNVGKCLGKLESFHTSMGYDMLDMKTKLNRVEKTVMEFKEKTEGQFDELSTCVQIAGE